MATHSSVLAWRIPGMGEPGGLLSMGRTESDTTEVTQQQQQQLQNTSLSLSQTEPTKEKFIIIFFNFMIKTLLCYAQSCQTLWVACQVPVSMGFSRQEYWSRFSFPPQGIFPIQESNPCLLRLLHWQAGSFPLSHLGGPMIKTTSCFLRKREKGCAQHHFNLLFAPQIEPDIKDSRELLT